MNPGDAVVYRGIDCPHWREAFNGEFAAQVFMNYVDQMAPRLIGNSTRGGISAPYQDMFPSLQL
jgi:hypothetical protein